jgi:transcriptional regulator with XRE-family HTH domain
VVYKPLDGNCAPRVQAGMHLSDYMAGKNPKRKVLKDEEVAEAIGVSRATVSRIRRRKVRPDWQTIAALNTFSKGKITADDFRENPERGEAAA